MQYTQRIKNLNAGIDKFIRTLDLEPETTEKIKDCLKHLETAEIHDLLAIIEEQIKENKTNLRNIKNETYIKEIYESYLYDEKSRLKNLIDNKIDSARICRNEIKKELQSLMNKNSELKKEIKRMEKENDILISEEK